MIRALMHSHLLMGIAFPFVIKNKFLYGNFPAKRPGKPTRHSNHTAVTVMHPAALRALGTLCMLLPWCQGLWLKSRTCVQLLCVCWTLPPFGWEQTFSPTGKALVLTPSPLHFLPQNWTWSLAGRLDPHGYLQTFQSRHFWHSLSLTLLLWNLSHMPEPLWCLWKGLRGERKNYCKWAFYFCLLLLTVSLLRNGLVFMGAWSMEFWFSWFPFLYILGYFDPHPIEYFVLTIITVWDG